MQFLAVKQWYGNIYPTLHWIIYMWVCKISHLMIILSYLSFWYLSIPTYIAVFVSCVKHLNMKTSIPPYENSIPSYVVLFLSLLALQFLASCLKHWYENIYPTLHCTFPCVPVTFLPFSEFYPTLSCGISIPTFIADFNLMCKTLI